MKRWTLSITRLAIVGLLGFSALGCGSSDDSGPTNNIPTGTSYNEQLAVAQAPGNAIMAAGIVQSGLGFAGGIGIPGPDRDEPVWDATDSRWEWTETYDYGGVPTSYTYTLQYLAGGVPQQEPTGADTMRYTFTGIGTSAQSGTTITYEFDYDIGYSGLDTSTILMDGEGSYTYEISIDVPGGQDIDTLYATSWHTVDPGVSIPLDGCPTGEIIYEMDPYTLTVAFNGTSTYTYNLVDGGGADVPSGSGDGQMGCGNPGGP